MMVLGGIVSHTRAQIAMKTIYKMNVKSFQSGSIGIVNGMKPNGEVDNCCLQSAEVWVGTNFAVAAYVRTTL